MATYGVTSGNLSVKFHHYHSTNRPFLNHNFSNPVSLHVGFLFLLSCRKTDSHYEAELDKGCEEELNNRHTLCSADGAFLKQLNFITSAMKTMRRRSEQRTAWPGEQPPDDGWRTAGNERLYQAALSSSSRSRQARFLSNCIGFSNFLFQDEWMEILTGVAGLLSATLGWLLLMIHLVFRPCPNTCWILLSVDGGLVTFLFNTLIQQKTT